MLNPDTKLKIFSMIKKEKDAGKISYLEYLALRGSHAHGVAGSDSDLDLVGFYSAPLEHYILGHNNKSIVIQEDGIDIVLYEASKFLNLAVGGNPNVLPCLFVDPIDSVIFTSRVGRVLVSTRRTLISTNVIKPFLGCYESYMYGINKVITGSSEQKDLKAISNGYILLFMLYSMLTTGNLTVKLPQADAEFVKNVRAGRVDITKIKDKVFTLEKTVRDIIEKPNKLEQPVTKKNVDETIISLICVRLASPILTNALEWLQ